MHTVRLYTQQQATANMLSAAVPKFQGKFFRQPTADEMKGAASQPKKMVTPRDMNPEALPRG